MKTLKLAVKTCEDSAFVDKKAENYGHAFLRLYNRFDESVDKTFIEELMSDFNMNAREYRYLTKDVKGVFSVTIVHFLLFHVVVSHTFSAYLV